MRTATNDEKGRCIAKRKSMDVKGLRFNKGQHLDRQRLWSTKGHSLLKGLHLKRLESAVTRLDASASSPVSRPGCELKWWAAACINR